MILFLLATLRQNDKIQNPNPSIKIRTLQNWILNFEFCDSICCAYEDRFWFLWDGREPNKWVLKMLLIWETRHVKQVWSAYLRWNLLFRTKKGSSLSQSTTGLSEQASFSAASGDIRWVPSKSMMSCIGTGLPRRRLLFHVASGRTWRMGFNQEVDFSKPFFEETENREHSFCFFLRKLLLGFIFGSYEMCKFYTSK